MTSIKPLESDMNNYIADWMKALSDVSANPEKEINFARWAE